MSSINRLSHNLSRTFLLGSFAALLMLAATGCQTVSFYSQAIQGQYQIFSSRQPVEKLITNQNTPPALKGQFVEVMHIREFAAKELKLPVEKHYLSYADLKRRFVVWNVHAAPEFSLEPTTWWYPVVGSLKYRGYFVEKLARDYARQLEARRLDVYVGGVEAYSTLGYFSDPLLNTFIHQSEWELAELLFHELAHQRLFAKGDTDFNEAFATAVADEGMKRWLAQKPPSPAHEAYYAECRRKEQFVALVMNARQELQSLYTRPRPVQSEHDSAALEALRAEKEVVLAQLRQGYEALKAEWGGNNYYDGWFARPLNNAQLNTVATYHHLVPAFQRLLQQCGGDLEAFYHAAERLAKLPADKRYLELTGEAPPAALVKRR